MGMRVSSVDALVAGQIAEIRENRVQRGEEARASAATTRPAEGRLENLNSVAANTLRAANLVQTAEEALAEIEARLRDIRDILAEAGSRLFLGNDDLEEAQEAINRNIIELNVLIGTTRFFGTTLFGGAADEQRFEFPGGDIIVIGIPNLSIERLGRDIGNQSGFENLSQVNVAQIPPGVRLPRGLTDAFLVTEAAAEEVRQARERVEEFRVEVFTSAFRALRAEREAQGLPESIFGEIDFAREAPEAVLSEILRRADRLAQNVAVDRTGMLLDLVI